jgi:hypothetical protein
MAKFKELLDDPDFKSLDPDSQRELLTTLKAPPEFMSQVLGPQELSGSGEPVRDVTAAELQAEGPSAMRRTMTQSQLDSQIKNAALTTGGMIAGTGLGTGAVALARSAATTWPSLGPLMAQGAARAYGAHGGYKAGKKVAGMPGALVGTALGFLAPSTGTVAGGVSEGSLLDVAAGMAGPLGKLAKMGKGIQALRAAEEAAPVIESVVKAAPAIEKVAEGAAKVGQYVPGTEKIIDGLKFVWGAKGGWKQAAGAAEKVAEAAPAVVEEVKTVAKGAEDLDATGRGR